MTTQLYMAIAVVFGIAGLLAFPGAMGLKLRIPRLKSADLMLLLAMAAIGIIGYGDKFSPTNNPPNGLNQPMMMMFNPQPAGPTVTETDVARGFSIVSVGTNEVFDFTMPTDGVRVAKWWTRGGSNDRAFVPGGIALIGGEILDALPQPSVRYCPLKATSLLVAGESEFWYQQTISNSTVYTWKDAYLLRNFSLPFSMQVELFGNGDFAYRYDLSRILDVGVLTNVVVGAKFGTNVFGDVTALLGGTNTVTSIYGHRLSEFDWDGDGLANEIDPAPYTNNGDCHGQGDGWVAACCTNAAEIAAAGGWTNWVAATVANDDDSWWYSFTITANAFDATGHAVVRIDGKAVVLSQDNDSATFLLMRGRPYPFSVEPSGATFFYSTHDGVQPQVEFASGSGTVSIAAGVELLPPGATLHLISGYGAAYFEARTWNLNPALDVSTSWSSAHGRLHITPAGDGVLVFWGGSTGKLSDTLYCDTEIDGYTNRQSAVVHFDPDPEPLPHVALSSPNTIFVNDDDDNGNGTNDYLDVDCAFSDPDDDIVPVVVELKSVAYVTNGTLRLSAQGLRIWENQDHIGTPIQSLTMTNCVSPFERTLYVERDSLSHSQVDECRLSLEWLECTDPVLGCATNMITAVEPIVEPIYKETFALNGTNFVYNPSCLVAGGPRVAYRVRLLPADYPQGEIKWYCDNSDVRFEGGNVGTNVSLIASVDARTGLQTKSQLTVQIGDAPSAAPKFHFDVVQPRVIKLHTRRISSSYAYQSPISDETLKKLSGVFAQIGVRFEVEDHGAIKRANECVFDAENMAPAIAMQELTVNDDGVSVFFVDKIVNAKAFAEPIYGMVFVPRYYNWHLLAHEVGHALGADDIYWSSSDKWPDDPEIKVDGPFDTGVVEFGFDWNNGTGQRFFQVGLAHRELIGRLLMCGVIDGNGVDIPHASVSGVASGGANGAKFEIRHTRVGRDAMNGENEL